VQYMAYTWRVIFPYKSGIGKTTDLLDDFGNSLEFSFI
jgi:hypothetical protein